MLKTYLLTLNTFLIALGLLNGPLVAAEGSDLKTSIELQQGYRRERFDFLGGAKHEHSGFRTKLQSRHVDVYSTRLQFKGINARGLFVQAAAGYGNVLRGHAEFSERFKRHGEMNRTGFHASRDYTADLGLFFGKEIWRANDASLAPRIGYAFYRQKFQFSNAVLKDHHDKKLHHVHARYKADWYSPQLGVRAAKEASSTCQLFADYAFLWPLKYHGSGSSVKRTGDSFKFHNTDKRWPSWGHIGVVGAKFAFASNWSLNLEYELSKFFARKGHQKIAHERELLHKAHRGASEIRLALGYNF